MNLSAPFIHRPVMTIFLMLSLVLAGWLAFLHLPVSDVPSIERPLIYVSTNFTGASSETVLNQVTLPLEQELSHVKGVEEITSSSSPGHSSITLTFSLDKKMAEALHDVQSALSHAEYYLPDKVHPTYYLQNDSHSPIQFLVLTSDHSSIADLRRYSDAYITPRLSRIEGIAKVQTYGSEKSIWLRLNPELMSARQITFNDVTEAVKQQTSELPLGIIQTGSQRLSIELPNAILNAKDLSNIRIGAIRLKDIAEISDKSNSEKEFHFATAEKNLPALVIGIVKASDANTVAVSKAVHETLDQMKRELPPSIQIQAWFDKAVWIQQSLSDVQLSLLFAFALVVLVIYFSLGRLAESLITTLALPLSILGTFAVMYLLNFSLDLLSLLALTLSVGFVVDDAIVVLENIVRHQEKGEKPFQASLLGSKQICFTILSMTFSLVAVFIPLLFMPGMNGRLFREFSVTLAVAILVSGFVSLTLTPMLCSRISHKPHPAKASRLSSFYARTLKPCLRHTKTVALVALLCTFATLYLFSRLPVNLIPPEDRGFFYGFVDLPHGLAATQITTEQRKVDALLQANSHIESFLSFNYNDFIFIYVRLKTDRPPQSEILASLQEKFDAIPGFQTVLQPLQLIELDVDFGSPGQYELVVRGLDYPTVNQAAQLLAQEMKSHPDFSFVQAPTHDTPMLSLHLNHDLAHQLGVSRQEVQQLLQHAYGQASIASIQKGQHTEKIYLELLPSFQNSKSSPSKLILNGIPLKSLTTWEEKLGSPTLHRRDQLASTSIRFSLAPSISPDQGIQLASDLSRILPDNTSSLLSGSAKTISQTIRQTLFLLLAAALVMYIVLGILYESFIHPLTILSSIPFAGLGGVLTLFLFNEPISIFSAVGFLLLIGIVKKNGIMMVDYAVEAEKQGISPSQAIYDACIVRFRPIMMTTIAAIMGAIPIALGLGDGAEMRQGLGLVIVGGLLFSQLLTLYVTPVLYLAFGRLKTKFNVIK
ncbi:MAG: efflux RND transporter permease subunit [Parachlamydia sp.]|nr:efflux RND transporter permease subunit [Parachlamydia sp.]